MKTGCGATLEGVSTRQLGPPGTRKVVTLRTTANEFEGSRVRNYRGEARGEGPRLPQILLKLRDIC
jgi:hypothetical protein